MKKTWTNRRCERHWGCQSKVVNLTFQCTRSIHQESGIAQSAYVAQGFSPVTFTTGTDGTMGTVEKRGDRINSIHDWGHMTTSRILNSIYRLFLIPLQELNILQRRCVRNFEWSVAESRKRTSESSQRIKHRKGGQKKYKSKSTNPNSSSKWTRQKNKNGSVCWCRHVFLLVDFFRATGRTQGYSKVLAKLRLEQLEIASSGRIEIR